MQRFRIQTKIEPSKSGDLPRGRGAGRGSRMRLYWSCSSRIWVQPREKGSIEDDQRGNWQRVMERQGEKELEVECGFYVLGKGVEERIPKKGSHIIYIYIYIYIYKIL